ncbi:2'-5' RNA ligase family protein [Streptomyces abikoensis]|uniref:2'-5' RNA ligase family protein n=1 Tax=Streptomyces abikoensis TaxID=97398 RepID=UPI0033E70714
MDNFFDGVTNRLHPWPAGRADLHFHILFDQEVIEKQIVSRYKQLTHRPGISPVPAAWVHTTILHSGPMDSFAPGEVDKIASLLQDECANIAPFSLTFDRPSIGSVAVECAARPGAPARRLWEAASQVCAEVTQSRYPITPAIYYPHLSIGYGTATKERQASRAEMKAWLSDCEYEPVTLQARSMTMVAQWHTGSHIRWKHLRTIPLSGSQEA